MALVVLSNTMVLVVLNKFMSYMRVKLETERPMALAAQSMGILRTITSATLKMASEVG